MRRRLILLSLTSVTILGSFLVLAHEQAATAEMKSLKIGVISPQSGPVAYFGMCFLRAVELAVKNVNTKGTTGKGPGIFVGNEHYKLEIVSYDDSADPAKSVAGMRKLAEMHKVPVVLGPFGTPHVLACQEVNVQLGILFNGMSASNQPYTRGNPLYIQDGVPGLYYGIPMAETCYNKGFRKACVLTDINEAFLSWGKMFQQKFESLGGQVLGFESVDIKNTADYHSVMTSFKAKNPDIIFISCYEEPSALAANHALDVGYQGKFLFSRDWGAKAEKIVGLEKIQASLIQTMDYFYYRKYPDQDKRGVFTSFHKQYMETYKEDYGVPAPSIHDSAWMLARAMEIASSVTDAYAIRAACPKALQERKLPLIYPNTEVLKNGLMLIPEMLLEVKGNGYSLLKELRVPREMLE